LIKKSHLSVLSIALLLPTTGFAEALDCTQSKHVAKQAFTMLKAGATLDSTIKSFEPTDFNKYMIKKLYDNKNIIKSMKNAEKSALKSCKYFS